MKKINTLRFGELEIEEQDGVTFEDVTEDTSKIYLEMVEPSILLDKLEEELEYKDEE